MTATFSVISTANASQDPKPVIDSQGEGLTFANFIPIFLVFAIFYFLIIRPQIRKGKEHQKMIDGIKVGTEVITSSGIIGKIRSKSDDKSYFDLEISPDVVVKISRLHVSEVFNKKDIDLKSKAPSDISKVKKHK